MLQRVGGLTVEPRSREWLYPGRPAIRSVIASGEDSIALRIEGLRAGELLRADGDQRAVWGAGPDLGTFLLPLREGLTRYVLTLDDGREERFTLEHVSTATQLRAGLSNPPVLTLANSTLGRPGAASAVGSWFAPPEPLLDVPARLRVPTAADPEEDLQALVIAYVRWSSGRHGTPNNRLIAASASEQLAMLDRNAARGMCGVFSQTLLALARARGHLLRIVLFSPADDRSTSHATLEVYWPSRRRWQLLDPTLGIWSAEDGDGRPLTALDLHLLMSAVPSAAQPVLQLVDAGTGALSRRPLRALPDSLRDRIADWFGGRKQVLYYDASSFRFRPGLRDGLHRNLTGRYGVYRHDDAQSAADRLLRRLHRILAVGTLVAFAVGTLAMFWPAARRGMTPP